MPKNSYLGRAEPEVLPDNLKQARQAAQARIAKDEIASAIAPCGRSSANASIRVKAAGGTFDDVVKATVFLTDLSHFALVNKIMAEYFREPYPARAAVGVAALPRGAQVEVECVVAL